MDAISKLEIATGKLKNAQLDLSCIFSLILNLVQVMDVKCEVLRSLEGAFCPVIRDLEGQSWEDTIDASACFLLRTILAKTEKDKLRAPHTSFEEIKDVGKVEKHVTQVLERVAKKGALLETDFPVEEEVVKEKSGILISTLNKKMGAKTFYFVEEIMPIGSKIGQASTRVLSARTSLLHKRQRLQQLQQKEDHV